MNLVPIIEILGWPLVICLSLPTLVCIAWLILRNVYGPRDSG